MKTINSAKKYMSDEKCGAVTKFDDLTHFIGVPISMLLHDTGVDIELVACKRVWDISFYAMRSKAISKPTSGSAFVLLEVTIIDPENLPYELDPNKEMFVIYDEWHFTRFSDTESAAKEIESTFNWYGDVKIDDFVTAIGTESPEYLLKMVLSRMNIEEGEYG